jgi:L-ascorbate metabolism protein UlaG (beta-lactamase superfamily)
MSENGARYRLADATAVEPLINRWSVWSDMISPLPYSLHMANYQMKTLESYLKRPEIHLKAARNPKLAGGAYVDVPEERAGAVQALLDATRREQEDNLRFARVAAEFQNRLAKEATGQSIEPFYQQLPDELRGYVELLYDYFNHPIVRFMESFLYQSDYYRKDLQSLFLFNQPTDHYRRFFLSTPRLPEGDQISVPLPFDDPRIDDLFRLDLEPQPLERIREILGLDPVDDARLLPLLSAEPAPPPNDWTGPGVRVRYFGHACVLVEYNGVTIMSDPWLGVLSTEREVERFSYRDLPSRIDFAVISHGHHDHFVLETLLRLRHRLGTLVVPRSYGMFYADTSLKLAARQCGFENVVEVDSFDTLTFPGGEITAVPFFGEHADLAHGKSGYVVRAGTEQILLAADSNCLDRQVYENIRKHNGPIATAFLGMECVGAPLSWLYGALLPIKVQLGHDQSRRTQACDSRRGQELVAAIGSRRAFNYAMGSEPWLEYGMGLGDAQESPQVRESNLFVAAVREKGLEAARLFGKYETYLGMD